LHEIAKVIFLVAVNSALFYFLFYFSHYFSR